MRVLLALMCAFPSLAAAEKQAGDQQFLDKAFSINKGEVELGKLAQQHGISPAVRDFGARLERDHQQALDTLPQVAREAGLMMPAAIQREESDLYTRLSRLQGKDFEQQFSKHMVQGHGKAISLFENEANHGQSPELRKWASQQLPVLKQHESIAKRDLSRM